MKTSINKGDKFTYSQIQEFTNKNPMYDMQESFIGSCSKMR